MVNKLFKHEMYAYLRTILPMHLVLFGIAILGRLIQLFDDNSTAYEIVFTSSVVVFSVGVVVCFLLTFILGIRRFYLNLFSSEGYLSFTLPVTQTQHIFVKNIVAVISQIASLIMIIISTCVITFGDVCNEIFKAIGYLFKRLYIEYNFHATLYIIEFLLAFIVAFATCYMLFYACIALGQRAKKNRVAAAVGVYFIYYFIVQVLSTIVIVIVNKFWRELRLDDLFEYLSEHTTLTIHLVLLVILVASALLGLLYYTITKKTITNKLNLE